MGKNTSEWKFGSIDDTPVNIAILAPRWLQEALSVLLSSEDSLVLVATAQDVDELISQLLPSSPDIIIIDADRHLNKAVEQITRIKTNLPSATCFMLVDQTSQNDALTKAGADMVLLKGAPPSHILEIIKEIAGKKEP